MTQSDRLPRNNEYLRRTPLSRLLVKTYRLRMLRKVSWRCALALEGGEMTSFTVRKILRQYHGVEVGTYSYGECLKPGSFPEGVSVGRYVSIAAGVKVFRRNHPTARLSTHPYFYNKNLGWFEEDQLAPSEPLIIGHDAWIGANAIITPRCVRIGIGAVIGAGSVVTTNVPDFAIAVGSPARVLRYRFPSDYQARILAGRWWELPIEEVMRYKAVLCTELGEVEEDNPLFPSAKG